MTTRTSDEVSAVEMVNSGSSKISRHDCCLRYDFILNLDTLFEREIDINSSMSTATDKKSFGGGKGTTNTDMIKRLPLRATNDDDDRGGLRLNQTENICNECNPTKTVVHRQAFGHYVDANEDPHREYHGQARGRDSEFGSVRQVLSNSDRSSIRTYPLRVIDQLRLCSFQTTPHPSDMSSYEMPMRMYGFECIHCNKDRKSILIRQKRRGFRKYPKLVNDIVRDLLEFRSHLNACPGISHDLISYLSWMEKWSRFSKVVKSVAIPISQQLDELRMRGNTQSRLLEAPNTMPLPVQKKIKTEENARKVNSDLAFLAKRSSRMRSHSVLENIASLA